MANSTYFDHVCPTCGRRLMIRVEYLGKRLVCQHCQGKFLANGSTGPPSGCSESGSDLLRRADELLQSSMQRVPEVNVQTQYPR